MPYARELAGKGGHADFVKNPDVVSFLEECTYLRPPSAEEAAAVAALYSAAPGGSGGALPRHVVASDASKSDKPVNDKLPSTQIGFLKVSHVLINMQEYAGLVDPGNRFVNPFKAAQIHREAHPVTFTMPGSNVRYKNNISVRSGFRQALYERFLEVGGASQGKSLVHVLRDLETLDNRLISVTTCPSCRLQVSASFTVGVDVLDCGHCGGSIYITDSLRLHEGISDFGDNSSAMTRMMNAVEHLMLAAFILDFRRGDIGQLAEVAFVLDGPLAVFGEPAKLSQRLQRLIAMVNAELSRKRLPGLLVLGLQKTGGLMDHARLIEPYLRCGTLRVIDDAYRNQYITGADSPADNFGNETYYGQDFIFKTESGRIFNFAIPYPFTDKNFGGGGKGFSLAKVELARYGDLVRQACDLIRHFEMDLYESAIVPIALAHRHASISLMPGGKVLDLIARGAFGR